MESQSEQIHIFIVQDIQLLKWKQVEDFLGCIKNPRCQHAKQGKTLKETDLGFFRFNRIIQANICVSQSGKLNIKCFLTSNGYFEWLPIQGI